MSKEHAGNRVIDCLDVTDERKTEEHKCNTTNSLKPFNCRSGQCLGLYELCGKSTDCHENNAELIYPWLFNFTCKDRTEFPCKNGTCISRDRQQCDHIIDYQPDGEDECFCDLFYSKDKQFSLNNIEEYPLINRDSSQTKFFDDDHSN